MHVDVEVGLFRLDDTDALLAEYVYEFLVDKFNAFEHCTNIFCLLHILEGTFHVVDDGQYADDGFLATIEDEVCLLLDGAFTVVVELCYLAEQLVFEADNIGICCFELFLDGWLLFFFWRVLFRLRCFQNGFLQFFFCLFFFHLIEIYPAFVLQETCQSTFCQLAVPYILSFCSLMASLEM